MALNSRTMRNLTKTREDALWQAILGHLIVAQCITLILGGYSVEWDSRTICNFDKTHALHYGKLQCGL